MPAVTSKRSRGNVALYIFIVVGAVFLLLIAFFLIDYFTGSSLLGILPGTSKVGIEKPLPRVNVQPLLHESLDFACPLQGEACSKGEWIKVPDPEREIFVAAWKDLPDLTPIFAMMDATEHTTGLFPEESGEEVPFLVIENRERGLQVTYRFSGTLSLPPDEVDETGSLSSGIKKAVQIGNISKGGVVSAGASSGYDLVVSIRDVSTDTYQRVNWSSFK